MADEKTYKLWVPRISETEMTRGFALKETESTIWAVAEFTKEAALRKLKDWAKENGVLNYKVISWKQYDHTLQEIAELGLRIKDFSLDTLDTKKASHTAAPEFNPLKAKLTKEQLKLKQPELEVLFSQNHLDAFTLDAQIKEILANAPLIKDQPTRLVDLVKRWLGFGSLSDAQLGTAVDQLAGAKYAALKWAKCLKEAANLPWAVETDEDTPEQVTVGDAKFCWSNGRTEITFSKTFFEEEFPQFVEALHLLGFGKTEEGKWVESTPSVSEGPQNEATNEVMSADEPLHEAAPEAVQEESVSLPEVIQFVRNTMGFTGKEGAPGRVHRDASGELLVIQEFLYHPSQKSLESTKFEWLDPRSAKAQQLETVSKVKPLLVSAKQQEQDGHVYNEIKLRFPVNVKTASVVQARYKQAAIDANDREKNPFLVSGERNFFDNPEMYRKFYSLLFEEAVCICDDGHTYQIISILPNQGQFVIMMQDVFYPQIIITENATDLAAHIYRWISPRSCTVNPELAPKSSESISDLIMVDEKTEKPIEERWLIY
jgi:hypothetical protein